MTRTASSPMRIRCPSLLVLPPHAGQYGEPSSGTECIPADLWIDAAPPRARTPSPAASTASPAFHRSPRCGPARDGHHACMTIHIAGTRSALIDERVPRVVAAVTSSIAAVVLVTGWWALLLALAADFVVRARGRPDWSPLARFVRDHVVPLLRGPRRPVAATPKQFAAHIGAITSTAAVVAALGFDAVRFAAVLVIILMAAALLEAAVELCIGCRLYAVLARAGVVADCPECDDISARLSRGE